jgi:hypothetical protein
LRGRLGIAARRTAEERYSWPAVAAVHLCRYEDLLSRKHQTTNAWTEHSPGVPQVARSPLESER